MDKITDRNKKIYEVLKNSPVFWNLINEARIKIKRENNRVKKEKVLEAESRRIVEENFLPSEWLSIIKKCLKDKSLFPPTTSNCQIVFNKNYKSRKTELFLKIFRKTTLDDIGRNWKNIKKFQKMLPEIKAKNINEQELKIYRWKKEGRSSRWITAVNGGGMIGLLENTVNQIYSRVRKLLGEYDTKNS